MDSQFKLLALFLLSSSSLLYKPCHCWGNNEKYCGSLYAGESFEGDNFTVPDGASFSNLEEEHISMEAVWNSTFSFKVQSGCLFTACNESYFEGQCMEFKTKLDKLPEGFDNVLSANCTCANDCKCQDVYNMRRNSCARAYLSKGGCNACNAHYTDLKGDKPIFPEEFENKVSSLMVRKGCQLHVYEEIEYSGDAISVEGIREEWNRLIGSYECSCSSDTPAEEKVGPTPIPTTRPDKYPQMISMPNTVDEISAMINGDYGRHPGLLAALQSLRIKRSPKNAYILLLGTTGSGKSSAINLLFDNPAVTKVGGEMSTTSDIHEFRIPVPVDELGIQNSELRVIDTPGLGDTRGLDRDANFLATLEEFLDGHEELKNRIPNIVLVFHKFNDNRFIGEGSVFIKMVRGLDSFRPRITDKKYSNVIFVLSHFTSETKKITRNPKEKLAAFKKVIEEYTQFPKPVIIVPAENKAAEEDLPVMNGYYRLPNGDFYPRNLFDKITQVTSGCGDIIGEAVIRTAFRNPDDFNVTETRFRLVDPKNSKVPRFLGILSGAIYNVNNTEVSQALTAAAEFLSTELKTRYPDALLYLQKSLNIRSINTMEDVPRTTTSIVELLTNLRQNDAILFLLEKAFGIVAPTMKENVLTGFSYNVFKDAPLTVSPFDLGKLKTSEIGYQFPELMTCVVDKKTKDVLHIFKSKKEYLEERIKSLGIGGSIPEEKFTGVTKSGCNLLDELTVGAANGSAMPIPITAVRELRTFELLLNDKFKLTPEFTKVIKSLTPFNESDDDSLDQWKSFFNDWGTHVVKSVYGGGAIEIQLTSDKPFNMDITQALLNFIQFAEDLALGKQGNSSLNQEGIHHTLKFTGGDQSYHTTDLTKMKLQDASELLEKWQDSLSLNPVILTTEMRLLPISVICKKTGQNISSEIERATGLLFKSQLTKPKVMTREVPVGREGTSGIQTTQMFQTLIDKMMTESREANKRFENLMLKMHHEQSKMDAVRQKFQEDQVKWQQEQEKEERELRKTQIDSENQRAKAERDARAQEKSDQLVSEAAKLKAEQDHAFKMAEIQEKMAVAQNSLITAIINQPKPKPPGGCLKEGTLILMSDKTQKPVEHLTQGDYIMDHNLKPTLVKGVLKKFLMQENFYGFDNSSFFFTDGHLLVGGGQNNEGLQLYVQSLEKLLQENPLLLYLNVKELKESSNSILSYDPLKEEVCSKQVQLFKDPSSREFPKETSVYIILVESLEGTYIANGFVCRHEIPPLEHWPRTMYLLFSIVSAPEVIKEIESIPYTVDSVERINSILEDSQKELKEILSQKDVQEVQEEPLFGFVEDEESLSERVILEIYENPTFSVLAVGIYGKLGPVLALKLDLNNDNSTGAKDKAKLHSYLLNHFKIYLTNNLRNEFNLN